jgi:hypothetical protein
MELRFSLRSLQGYRDALTRQPTISETDHGYSSWLGDPPRLAAFS